MQRARAHEGLTTRAAPPTIKRPKNTLVTSPESSLVPSVESSDPAPAPGAAEADALPALPAGDSVAAADRDGVAKGDGATDGPAVTDAAAVRVADVEVVALAVTLVVLPLPLPTASLPLFDPELLSLSSLLPRPESSPELSGEPSPLLLSVLAHPGKAGKDALVGQGTPFG